METLSSRFIKAGAALLTAKDMQNRCSLRSAVHLTIGEWYGRKDTRKKGFTVPPEHLTIDNSFIYATSRLKLKVLLLTFQGKDFLTFVHDEKEVTTYLVNTHTSLMP